MPAASANCPVCGNPVSSRSCPRCADRTVFRIIHRDLLWLVLLAGAAVAFFLFTRAMAARLHEINVRTAAIWYEKGRSALRAGNINAAMEDFRRASVNDHDNFQYSLALARALAAGNHEEEARPALLGLREIAPEDANVNLELARLAAKRGDVSTAVRYYQNALYGVWPEGEAEAHRGAVRLELIRFLLEHKQNSSALSELLRLGPELPNHAASQMEAGALFLRAGDPQRALSAFQSALRLAGKEPAALAGAGQAAFALGDYARAERYLAAATAAHADSGARKLLATSRRLLANDPLGAHLSEAERSRRLLAGYDHALQRLQNCAASGSEKPELAQLAGEARALKAKLMPGVLRHSPELLESGLEMIYRMEEAGARICGQGDELDEALLLIGRKRQGAAP